MFHSDITLTLLWDPKIVSREQFNVESLLSVWTYNSENVELWSLHVAGLSFVPTGYTLFSYKFWTLVVVSIFVAGPQCHSEPLTFNHHS